MKISNTEDIAISSYPLMGYGTPMLNMNAFTHKVWKRESIDSLVNKFIVCKKSLFFVTGICIIDK